MMFSRPSLGPPICERSIVGIRGGVADVAAGLSEPVDGLCAHAVPPANMATTLMAATAQLVRLVVRPMNIQVVPPCLRVISSRVRRDCVRSHGMRRCTLQCRLPAERDP